MTMPPETIIGLTKLVHLKELNELNKLNEILVQSMRGENYRKQFTTALVSHVTKWAQTMTTTEGL